MNENELGNIIVNTAIHIHKRLGPGIFENVYEIVLMKLLAKKGLFIQRQVSIPIEFEGEHFDEGFKIDLICRKKSNHRIKICRNYNQGSQETIINILKIIEYKTGLYIKFWRIINGTIN